MENGNFKLDNLYFYQAFVKLNQSTLKWDEYLADLFNIMQTDSNQQATPISVDRNSQYEIDNVFNYATYGKVMI